MTRTLGKYAGEFLGRAVGATAGCLGASLGSIPGFGQLFALRAGGAALLGHRWCKVNSIMLWGRRQSVLDRLGLGRKVPTMSKAQTALREVERIRVVDLRGRIAFGEGNTMLRETIAGLMTSGGSQKIVLNLKEVDFIDGSGIGELVRSHMAIRKQGGQLKLANLSSVVNDLLHSRP